MKKDRKRSQSILRDLLAAYLEDHPLEAEKLRKKKWRDAQRKFRAHQKVYEKRVAVKPWTQMKRLRSEVNVKKTTIPK
jgi:hypothetical protein